MENEKMRSRVGITIAARVARLRSQLGRLRSPPEISSDDLFAMLKNQRRRDALSYLRNQGTQTSVSLADLAEAVAARENDCEPAALSSAQRKRVYVALKQSHLPKLADTGFIEYDPDRGQISVTDQAAVCDAYLEVLPGRAFPWSEYYLGLGAVSTTLLVGVWLEIHPFSIVPPMVWAGVITAAFTISAIVHVVVQRRHSLL